jgi:hypothetical protein
MPFSADPYRRHTRLQQLLAAPAPEDEAAVVEAGASFVSEVHASAAQVDQYEPKLGPVLSSAVPGKLSPIIRSSRLRAFLAVRLHEREAERPLSVDDEDDRRQIIEQLLRSSSQKVMDAFADHQLAGQPDRDRLLAACSQALAAGPESAGSAEEP